MCTGRVDLSFIFRAFESGADGVFIGGCYPGECHYLTEGNYHALNLVHLSRKLLEHVGVNPERLRIEWIASSDGVRFADLMNDFALKLRRIGPLGKGEGLEEIGLASGLETVKKLIPYIKLVKGEKLAMRPEREEDYAALYTSEEIESLFRDVVSYHIDPEKCQACMICLRKCPVDAITGAKKQVHVIDQDRCIKCGTCFEACPPRFGAVQKITGAPVPLPIPEAERTMDRSGMEK